MIVEATYILFLYPPTIEGSFSAKIGMGFDKTSTDANMEVTLSNCHSFEDVIKKSMEILEVLKINRSTDFVLVYPFSQSNDKTQTQRVIDRSWELNEIAMINGWRFDKQVPFYQPNKTIIE